jgi:hypothetical protein
VQKIKVPTLLSFLVTNALSGVADLEFTILRNCPFCGGEVKYHDIRKKRFATIEYDGEKHLIHVRVHRFYCRECGKLCYAHAPFYPDTKFGAPVIDLCMTIARDHAYNYTARVLKEMGVVVDRGTVRNFFEKDIHDVSYVKIYGHPIPLSIFSLSDLVFRATPQYPLSEEDVLSACDCLPT